jgi:hypothetical protein
MTPNVGPYDPAVISDACAAMFNNIGPAVFVTHSQGGGLGWATVLKTSNVRGIVAYILTGIFAGFPGDEVTAKDDDGNLGESHELSHGDADRSERTTGTWKRLRNFSLRKEEATAWLLRLEMARKWRDTVNRHGGDVTVVHLPEFGWRPWKYPLPILRLE